MKKITLIIALLGIAIMSFAEIPETIHQDVKDLVTVTHEDAKSIVTTVYNDGKSAACTLYPEVKEAVISIAKAIGVAAEHVYTVLVKKFVVDAIVEFLPFLLGIILLGIGWYKFSQYFKNNQRVEWHIIYPCILIIIGLISLCNVDYNTMVMGFFNPEYGALNYILEYSKQMIK